MFGGTTGGALDHERWLPAPLLAVAAAGWWWSARMAAEMDSGAIGTMAAAGGAMSMSLGAFVLAWALMMAAMMFPAIVPVVRLYARAARAGTVASTWSFASGYLLVWSSVGIPAWWAWRGLRDPLADAAAWAAYLAGGVLLAAAAWQLAPLKQACLRHCRSPMSFFLHLQGDLRRPAMAVRAGAQHGAYCLGCCWALMAVLVAVGTMHLGWMVALTALIAVEKLAPGGDWIGRSLAVALGALGLALLVHPALLANIT